MSNGSRNKYFNCSQIWQSIFGDDLNGFCRTPSSWLSMTKYLPRSPYRLSPNLCVCACESGVEALLNNRWEWSPSYFWSCTFASSLWMDFFLWRLFCLLLSSNNKRGQEREVPGKKATFFWSFEWNDDDFFRFGHYYCVYIWITAQQLHILSFDLEMVVSLLSLLPPSWWLGSIHLYVGYRSIIIVPPSSSIYHPLIKGVAQQKVDRQHHHTDHQWYMYITYRYHHHFHLYGVGM